VRLFKASPALGDGNSYMTSTLWQLRRGESCVIDRFDARLHDTYRTRMVELGFHPGAAVTCVVAPRLGAPKLFRVGNAVYSLEKQVAELVITGGEAA
jgi:Fe2+ transport system protein FeoA